MVWFVGDMRKAKTTAALLVATVAKVETSGLWLCGILVSSLPIAMWAVLKRGVEKMVPKILSKVE